MTHLGPATDAAQLYGRNESGTVDGLPARCPARTNERLSAEGLSTSRSREVEPVKDRVRRVLTPEQRDLLKKQIDARVRERLVRRGERRTELPDLSHLSRKKP